MAVLWQLHNEAGIIIVASRFSIRDEAEQWKSFLD